MGDRWDKPYLQRTDLEKLQTQWIKANGLLDRHDWSAAVVRVATAMEMAANFAIIEELRHRPTMHNPSVEQVPWLSMDDKIRTLRRLLSTGYRAAISTLKAPAIAAYKKRNRIVHQGEFCEKEEALRHAQTCERFVPAVVCIRRPEFVLSREARPSEEDPGS